VPLVRRREYYSGLLKNIGIDLGGLRSILGTANTAKDEADSVVYQVRSIRRTSLQVGVGLNRAIRVWEITGTRVPIIVDTFSTRPTGCNDLAVGRLEVLKATDLVQVEQDGSALSHFRFRCRQEVHAFVIGERAMVDAILYPRRMTNLSSPRGCREAEMAVQSVFNAEGFQMCFHDGVSRRSNKTMATSRITFLLKLTLTPM
jgi:hypothetical protein